MKKNINRIPDESELAAYVDQHLRGLADGSCDFPLSTKIFGAAYSRTCIGILKNCRITPEIIRRAAVLHLMYYDKPKTALILIGRNKKIKDIVRLCDGYCPKFSDYVREINYACGRDKVRRCALIYNFPYKYGKLEELEELSALYDGLLEEGVTLVDVIRFHEGKSESLMIGFNRKGYD